MQELANKTYELMENTTGHATHTTMMIFGPSSEPCKGVYSGANIIFGQALVNGQEMLYQAMETDGQLTAGRATVSLVTVPGRPSEMHLQWQWLTGDLSSGVSKWRQVEV